MKTISILRNSATMLALIVSAAFMLEACAKEPLEGGGIITMTTKAYEVIIYMNGAEDITIDWGDGQNSNVKDAVKDVFYEITSYTFSHKYSGTAAHDIVITGNVTGLSCSDIQLTALNVSRNTALINLDCRRNQLTSLDVSRNTALKKLSCGNNQLTSLDVSRNTMLTDLTCSSNYLTILDVSRNTLLEWLMCEYNQIKNLDVRNNADLWMLTCGGNLLTTATLNDLFRTLPDRTQKDDWGSIYIDNPQDSNIDRSIAEKKKWDVSKQR